MTSLSITNEAELAHAFAARGWRISYDDTRMPSADLRAGDRVLHALLTKRSPVFPFSFDGWVTTDPISVAYTVILHPKKRIAVNIPLALSPSFRVEKQSLTDDDLDLACAEWVNWAKQVDLDAAYAALLDKDANDKGDMPARHLAALAATGNVAVLEHYSDAFAQGDRLGFVPYITADYVEAALAFARQRKEDPEWLPRSPSFRV